MGRVHQVKRESFALEPLKIKIPSPLLPRISQVPRKRTVEVSFTSMPSSAAPEYTGVAHSKGCTLSPVNPIYGTILYGEAADFDALCPDNVQEALGHIAGWPPAWALDGWRCRCRAASVDR